MRFPLYHQQFHKDCGSACLHMIASFYGKNYNSYFLFQLCYTTDQGTSLLNLSSAAEKIGFWSLGVKLNFHDLFTVDVMPLIAHIYNHHFVVVYKIDDKYVYVADPAKGQVNYSHKDFLQIWMNKSDDFTTKNGVALLIKPA